MAKTTKTTKAIYGVRGREHSLYTGAAHSTWTERFKTLAEVQAYVRDRWEGVEYIDSAVGFHTDYCSYTLIHCTLRDLGRRDPEDRWFWLWHDLTGQTEQTGTATTEATNEGETHGKEEDGRRDGEDGV